MFGHDSKPSRIWSFACSAPIDGGEIVSEQALLAHRYRNRLCELELAKRQRYYDLLASHCPEIEALEAQEQAEVAHLAGVQASVRQQHQQARSRKAGAADRQAVRQAKDRLRQTRQQLRAARLQARENPVLVEALRQSDEQSHADQLAARATCGLFWGNYLAVEQACARFKKGQPPRFRRWTGEGRVVLQVQKGMAWQEALACDDTRLRIERVAKKSHPSAPADPDSKRSQRVQKAIVWMRVNSTDKGKPVWARVLATLHRQPPEGARIKWVYLRWRRAATHQQWQIQFVLERESWDRPVVAPPGSAVGIDLGWRIVPEGLRVAAWKGNDSRSGELVIPTGELSRWRVPPDLHGIRAVNFNTVKLQLRTCLADNQHPDWLRDRVQTLAQWESQARLAAVVIDWRTQRFAGDEAIFQIAEDWRKQDKHLYDWEIFQSRKAEAWRKDRYRNWVAELRQCYETAFVEATDWRELMRSLPEEEEGDVIASQRFNARIASPGALTELIVAGFPRSLRIDPAGTTTTCHVCNADEAGKFDQATQLIHTCVNGHVWDQDHNAAANLLARGEVVNQTPATARETEGPIAP